MTWIQTYDGAAFDILDPKPEAIDPRTIAVALSRLCRFGGHAKYFYSVGQHSLLVSDLVTDPEFKLPALLHDAHECYWGFGDICRPAKSCIDTRAQDELIEIQWKVDCAVAARFGFDPSLMHHPQVKHADCVALFAEQRDLMLPAPRPWVDQVKCDHVPKIRARASETVAGEFLMVLDLLTAAEVAA